MRTDPNASCQHLRFVRKLAFYSIMCLNMLYTDVIRYSIVARRSRRSVEDERVDKYHLLLVHTERERESLQSRLSSRIQKIYRKRTYYDTIPTNQIVTQGPFAKFQTFFPAVFVNSLMICHNNIIFCLARKRSPVER